MKKKKMPPTMTRRAFFKVTGAGTTAMAVGLAGCADGDGDFDADGDVAQDDVREEDLLTEGDLPQEGEGDISEAEGELEGCPDMPPYADTREVKEGTETTTICPYCGCGCGLLVTVATVEGEPRITNIEGDPDHPINMGSLCPKGAALYQVNRNDRRLSRVLHRSSGASDWEEMTWDAALDAIAQRMKATRDASFTETDGSGRTVNRTEAIACLGGASLDNEECYLLSKAMRSMGLVYMEHQARI